MPYTKIEIYFWGQEYYSDISLEARYENLATKVAIPFLWDCYLHLDTVMNYPNFLDPFGPRVRKIVEICKMHGFHALKIIQAQRKKQRRTYDST